MDKRLAVCRAHNLFAMGEQIMHLQTEKNFRPGTRPGRKWIAFDLPPAGGKLCEALLKSCPARPCGKQSRAGVLFISELHGESVAEKFQAILAQGGEDPHLAQAAVIEIQLLRGL